MARKDIFRSVMNLTPASDDRNDAVSYAASGASRSIKSSFEELAKGSVVNLDPDVIDGSFVTDRINDDDDALQDLVAAIGERGQDTPILVRPHPTVSGRYQIVFGHRRTKAARVLGRPVRAIVKPLADQDHVIAQGQENAVRSNLSFIERTLFAKRLADLGYDQTVVKSALALDATTFSKMLTVSGSVPENMILAIGAAKATGRDRWWQLSKFLQMPGSIEKAYTVLSGAEATSADGDTRFNMVFNALSKATGPVKKKTSTAQTWQSTDKSIKVDMTNSGRAFTLALKAKNASRFGAYLADNLEELYRAFKESETVAKTGD